MSHVSAQARQTAPKAPGPFIATAGFQAFSPSGPSVRTFSSYLIHSDQGGFE